METYALYLAYRDPRVPRYARVFTALVVGYAFSPMDLIPAEVLAEHRHKAWEYWGKPVSKTVVVAAVWLVLAALAVYLVAGVVL